MSVLIKGMEMPKCCLLCPFCVPEADEENGEICILSGQYPIVNKDERNVECPLVELPEKHGRLIDADALLKKFCGHCDGYEECGTNKIRVECYDLGLINHSPTIIEAEDGE